MNGCAVPVSILQFLSDHFIHFTLFEFTVIAVLVVAVLVYRFDYQNTNTTHTNDSNEL